MNKIEQQLTFIERHHAERVGSTTYTVIYSSYLCRCGDICVKRQSDVNRDKVKSCGNCNGHKMSKTRFYRIWKAMKTRSINENYHQYYLWGGKGVQVCDKWKLFPGFIDDMYDSYKEHVKEFGEKNTTLDRINGNGNYTPENCRWATIKEQIKNRRVTLHVVYDGALTTIPELAELTNIPKQTLYDRYYHGRNLV